MLFSGFFAVEYFEHLNCRYRNTGTGAEDCGNTGFVKEVVILGGYHTAGSDHDVFTAELLELFDNLRNQSLVACGERADAKDVDIVFHCLTGGFCRGLEQRPHIYVKTTIGIACSYDFSSAVMSVLTHFCYHDAGLTALAFRKFLGEMTGTDEICVVFGF